MDHGIHCHRIPTYHKVIKARCSKLALVNCAYTSQIDSKTCHLEGRRVGDKFYHANGDVSQSDHNAACNIKTRYCDKTIKQYMPYRKFKSIFLDRLHARDDELAKKKAANLQLTD